GSTVSIAQNSSVQNTSSGVKEISDEKVKLSNLNQLRTPERAGKRDTNLDSKNSILDISNAIMKFDKSINDYIKDQSHEHKQKSSELNSNYNKNVPRKGKKGVDFLLEKLESCKKFVNLDNQESPLTNSQINERLAYRFKSMSPDHDKSRSPNSREDDVISPSLSYDDSNDMKQRRKRKLGKPVKLAKELKFTKVHSTFKDFQSQIISKSNSDENSYSSFTSSVLQKDSENSKKIESDDKERDFEVCQKKGIKLKDMDEKKIELNEMDKKKLNQCEKLSILDMSRHLLDTLKNSESTKQRRSSECVFDVCKINQKMRRKSCDDLKNLLSESAPKINVSNQTTAFYEVESQLEKMFAGIIEIDKNVSKTAMAVVDLDKSDEANSEDKTFFIHNSLNKTLLNTQNENIKNQPKTLLKIRTNKAGVTNKISNDRCINVKRNNKNQTGKPKLLKKKLLKKKCNMTFNESAHESTINSNTIKCKGPIIQMKGFQKIPSYIQIINAPKEDDEEKSKDKRRIPSIGIIGRSSKTFQSNADYRGKMERSEDERETAPTGPPPTNIAPPRPTFAQMAKSPARVPTPATLSRPMQVLGAGITSLRIDATTPRLRLRQSTAGLMTTPASSQQREGSNEKRSRTEIITSLSQAISTGAIPRRLSPFREQKESSEAEGSRQAQRELELYVANSPVVPASARTSRGQARVDFNVSGQEIELEMSPISFNS
ncbi:hypothetical protein TSAR_013799, partial [Trichomalopsis sarcophagae]